MSQMKQRSRTDTPKWDIFDSSVTKHIDALQIALVRAGRDTLLPELYEIFGKEATIKFLDIFAGTTVEVPTKKIIEDAIRDTFIYLAVKKVDKAGKNDRADVVHDLANRYSIDEQQIRIIYLEMEKFA